MKKLLLIGVLFLAGCTENQRGRTFGGEMTKVLPKGEKLVNATWKETSLWILTRPAKPGELPETYIFKEDSSFGIMEGTLTIKEQ